MGSVARWTLFTVIALSACVGEEEGPARRDAQSDGASSEASVAMDGAAAEDARSRDATLEDARDAQTDSGARDTGVDVPTDTRCMGPEVCNDVDDNCDGRVDEGCPRAVDVTIPPRFAQLSRGAASGNHPQSVAGRTEVLVGFYGRKGGVVDNLGALTAPLTVVADTTRVPFAYVVRTGAVSELPAYGGSGGSGFRELCPTDTILTTLRVVHRNGCTSPGICYEVVGDLIGQCARVTLAQSGATWSVSYTPTSELRVMGSDSERSTYMAPPGPYGGLWLQTGAFVDQLGLGQVDVQLQLR